MYFEGAVFFFIFAVAFQTVVVAQLVRASDCDSEGRGFEPPRLPTKRGRLISKMRRFFLSSIFYWFSIDVIATFQYFTSYVLKLEKEAFLGCFFPKIMCQGK